LDSERAKQIISSSDNIEVLFDGTPVWINSVDANNTAQITYLENHNKQVVPVYKLIEINPK
jgi:small acid-soluble spore protein, H-type